MITHAEALGRVIAAQRVLHGAKRKDLAAASTLSYPYVSEIEAGLKEPSLPALRLIAGALDVYSSDLLRLAERLREENG